jgi:hypothetical protein
MREIVGHSDIEVIVAITVTASEDTAFTLDATCSAAQQAASVFLS